MVPSARNSARLEPEVWETIILRTLGLLEPPQKTPLGVAMMRCKGVDDVNDLFFF